MISGRRSFLSGIALTLAGIQTSLAGPQQRQDPTRPPAIPDASGATARDEIPLPPAADPKIMLKEEQKELRKDVDRLVQMVKDLKNESDKTPETDVLSLSLVKKAEDIEKLAHQIKERIRNS